MPLVQAMETNPAMVNVASIAVVWRRVDAVMAILLLEDDRAIALQFGINPCQAVPPLQ